MGRLLTLVFLLPRLSAQQAPARDSELIQQLLRRVEQLEAEVRELKASQGAPAAAAAADRQTTASVQAPGAQPSPLPQPPPSPAPPAMGHDQMGASGIQFRGFSDVTYRSSTLRGETNSFMLGQFNLFMTSRLSDRLSVLAEAVLEAGPDNSFGFELERMFLQYAPSDYFNISFGRQHTGIGYYNTAYHHSTWLQTATERPFLFAFEDEGGILPIHNVGLSATGRIPSGPLGLRYVAEVGNGRASRSPLDEPVQNVRDENNGKAFNLALIARPERWRGFQTGFSVYRDRLIRLDLPKIGETILAGHIVYRSSGFEWLNEGVVVRHAFPGGREVLTTPGFYTQIARRVAASLRPYFRYQYVNAPGRDPMIGDVGLIHGPSAGIRYDFSEFAAFKLQYDRTERGHLGGFNALATQVSFTF